jgi:hypothetical protein
MSASHPDRLLDAIAFHQAAIELTDDASDDRLAGLMRTLNKDDLILGLDMLSASH